MELTSIQKNLLIRIKNGETDFTPESEDMTLENFQTVANALIELKKNNSIHTDEPHRREIAGNVYVDRVVNALISPRIS